MVRDDAARFSRLGLVHGYVGAKHGDPLVVARAPTFIRASGVCLEVPPRCAVDSIANVAHRDNTATGGGFAHLRLEHCSIHPIGAIV